MAKDIQPLYGDRLAYRVGEVAELTGLSRTTVWAAIRRQELRVCRIGQRATRVRIQDLHEFLDRAAQSPEDLNVPAPAPRGRSVR
jgi:excisionase family DNA binding protein